MAVAAVTVSHWLNGADDGFSIGDSNGGGSDRGVVAGGIGGDSGGCCGDNGNTDKVGSEDGCSKFGNYEGADNSFAFDIEEGGRGQSEGND